MENYKIRVNSKAESKEAQELFFELGCEKGAIADYYPSWISNFHEFTPQERKYTSEPADHWLRACKEITLPELRDLVVLKRNSIDDANAFRHDNGVKYYITSDNKYYYFSNILTFEWTESCNDIDYLEKHVKPIEKKEMKAKEYLKKIGNDEYMLMDGVGYSGQDNWIEIPEGSETFNFYERKDNLFFLKGSGEDTMFSNDLNDWDWKHWGDIDFDGVVCLWSRHTHPEELPFIDDEPSLGNSKIGRRAITVKIPVESLNDQYAEIERVRQSAWKKQEGGSHYKNLKIQPMQYALENKLDYAQANVVKYVTRHKEKNGKEDLLKAIHNIELMIEFYYGDEK